MTMIPSLVVELFAFHLVVAHGLAFPFIFRGLE